jgi:hypothetical protein
MNDWLFGYFVIYVLVKSTQSFISLSVDIAT